MPSLHILKGANEGALIPVDGDRFVIGRNPECGIVIPVTSVSREHAHILRVQGRYFIEDLRSRNGTFVNDKAVTSRTLLKNNDRVRICDFLATFLDRQTDEGEAEDEEGSTSTVEAMLSHSSHLLWETQPAEKLRGMLEISAKLSKTLELDALLPKIVDELFGLFRQADRCFIIQTEEGSKRLMPRVVKTRRPQDETNARFSRSIVQKCLDTAQAFLSDDASRDDRIPLTQEDHKFLCGVANQAAIALDNARMHAEAVARERLKRDLELAHRVQLSFLPAKLPEVAGYEFYAHYEPANEVGGDYYGFVPLPQGRLAITVGDVAGKGVAAALLMAKLSSDTRFCLLTENDYGRALAKLNVLLYEFASPLDRFVTFAAAILDPARHTVTLASAGHQSPLLHRREAGTLVEAVPSQVAGVPLGIDLEVTFDTCQVTLQPGDTLVLFTDGVTDALDVRGNQFTVQGVNRAIAEAGAASPKGVGEHIVKAVQQHAAGRSPFDDLTLVCLGRTA
jgi:sigma-B regulation protein RsbU (phosphoserine phosphatase)